MTITEILAKVTGLEGKSAEQAAALSAETAARTALEAKLQASEALLAEQSALVSKLKAAADAPPAKEGEDEEASVTDAIKALENAITVLKGIAGQSEAPADEQKAEDGADEEDDMEAKKECAAKNFKKAFAIRQKQLNRKLAKAKTATVSTAAVEKIVSAKIAALGIPAPLALNKDGANPIRAQKPDGSKRAHALVRNGFNEQPAVAALNQALGRN